MRESCPKLTARPSEYGSRACALGAVPETSEKSIPFPEDPASFRFLEQKKIEAGSSGNEICFSEKQMHVSTNMS